MSILTNRSVFFNNFNTFHWGLDDSHLLYFGSLIHRAQGPMCWRLGSKPMWLLECGETFKRWDLEEGRWLGHALQGDFENPGASCLLFLLSCIHEVNSFFCCVFPPWCTALPQAQKQSWAEISQAMSQTFFFWGGWFWGLNSALLGRCSTTWAFLQPFLALVNFGIGSQVFAWAGLDCDSLIYASYIAMMTGAHYHAQLLVKIGILLTFSLGWPSTAIFLITTSQIAGITGMRIHTLLSSLSLSWFISGILSQWWKADQNTILTVVRHISHRGFDLHFPDD
jgi:hypothetical protein